MSVSNCFRKDCITKIKVELFPVLARVSLALSSERSISGGCVRFSLGSGFLYINKHVCKQICPVWLQGRKDWIHAFVEAPLLGGGGGLHPFCFGACLFNPPSPPPRFFLLSWSYCGLACPATHLLSPRPLLCERPLGIDYYRELVNTLFRK